MTYTVFLTNLLAEQGDAIVCGLVDLGYTVSAGSEVDEKPHWKEQNGLSGMVVLTVAPDLVYHSEGPSDDDDPVGYVTGFTARKLREDIKGILDSKRILWHSIVVVRDESASDRSWDTGNIYPSARTQKSEIYDVLTQQGDRK